MAGISLNKHLILLLFAIVIVSGISGCPGKIDRASTYDLDAEYSPLINPSDFTSEITNPYFSMPVGKKMIYEAKKEEGVERIEILIPGWTRNVSGVETLVFWDRVYLDGELIEDTRDYIAQDKEGNVWYFGEHVDNYAGGKLVDHEGAWLSGVNGAKPGIWMKANPKVGEEYRQEYYKDLAEDIGRVEGVMVEVSVPAGNYKDCVKIFEWSPLFSATAYKYHCSVAGATVLEEEDKERVELLEIDLEGAKCISLPDQYAAEGVMQGAIAQCEKQVESGVKEAEKLETKVTEERAKEIALAAVPGRITDTAIETKFGKPAYVVEIIADSDGVETDVIIDVDSGEILAIEK